MNLFAKIEIVVWVILVVAALIGLQMMTLTEGKTGHITYSSVYLYGHKVFDTDKAVVHRIFDFLVTHKRKVMLATLLIGFALLSRAGIVRRHIV